MSRYFNDSPIESPADDTFGVAAFAQSLAKSIVSIKEPIGSTIALQGPWGSGKSSVVNLIRKELASQSETGLKVTEFKCWWFRGEEALALAFLQSIHSAIEKSVSQKAKESFKAISKKLLQAGPVVGSGLAALHPILGSATTAATKYLDGLFSGEASLEKLHATLSDALIEQNKRFLIIIDDIDRLKPVEMVAILQMVKSVGNLPNVMYLLVFDRILLEKAVDSICPSDGPHFIEKIVQASFDLPKPLQIDLNNAVVSAFQEICGSVKPDKEVRFFNVFYDAVSPYITTPRHIARLRNAISVTWPAIANEVDAADFLAMETIRLYEPTLFNAVLVNREVLLGVRDRNAREDDRARRFRPFLEKIPPDRHEFVKSFLTRLFPRMDDMGYGFDFIPLWDSDRRLCIETHFTTYARLSLSEDVLQNEILSEIVLRCDDIQFVADAFIAASHKRRKNGESLVPVYLDGLMSKAKSIPTNKLTQLFGALFKIHDQIDLEQDQAKGFLGLANTSLRYHWLIRRLTSGRLSLPERSELYLRTVPEASIAWLVDFADSALNDHFPREGRPKSREEDCLTTEADALRLKEIAVSRIRQAAADQNLAQHKDVMYILYRWRSFAGDDPSEVRQWTDKALNDDLSVVGLARAMTGRSWSHTAGDRVSKMTIKAHVNEDSDVLDVPKFRAALERIREEAALDEKCLVDVRTFLSAWDESRSPNDEEK